MTQAQFFVDRAHYERTDQFICVLQGHANIELVPHINKQEMYTGHAYSFYHPERDQQVEVQYGVNESPVNLFNPDYKRHQNFSFVDDDKKYHEKLEKGDCIFVPAFYFYQIQGEAESQV